MKENQAKTPFMEEFGKFERIGSLYTAHTQTRTNLYYGHSKPKNQAEKPNKQDLLKEMTLRIMKSKTGQSAESITFYRNRSDNDKDSVKMYTLYKNRYVLEPEFLKYEWLRVFLDFLYTPQNDKYHNSEMFPTDVPSAMEKTKDIPAIPVYTPKTDVERYDQRLYTVSAVIQYANRALAEGHPEGMVSNWYRKFIEKNERSLKQE